MSTGEDLELLRQIHADKNQFAKVYDEYYKPIFGYVFRRVSDYDLARDITSECFLKAFLNVHKYRWKGLSISSWLYRIATNEINMYFRKNRYAPLYLSQLPEQRADLIDPVSTSAEKAEVERQLRESEDFVIVQKNLSNLSMKYQEVIALRFFEDKSIKEISEVLDKKEGTIKSLLSRGIEKLRTALTDKK